MVLWPAQIDQELARFIKIQVAFGWWNVQPKISIAEVVFSCDYMQRGDVPRAFRGAPGTARIRMPENSDHFAPVSGKPVERWSPHLIITNCSDVVTQLREYRSSPRA